MVKDCHKNFICCCVCARARALYLNNLFTSLSCLFCCHRNEALTYSNYTPTIRHSGYDVSNYQYDVNTSSHKLTSMTEQAYVYQGYNEMSDVFMTSPALGPDQNKRRFEGDQSARSGKRHPRDMFYYEPTFTNI